MSFARERVVPTPRQIETMLVEIHNTHLLYAPRLVRAFCRSVDSTSCDLLSDRMLLASAEDPTAQGSLLIEASAEAPLVTLKIMRQTAQAVRESIAVDGDMTMIGHVALVRAGEQIDLTKGPPNMADRFTVEVKYETDHYGDQDQLREIAFENWMRGVLCLARKKI